MPRHCLGSTHQLRSGAARLVRLAAVTCLALAVVGSAAVWAQPVGVVTAGNRCIHDELQQRVLQSVAQEHDNLGTLSAVGLPVVAAAPDLDSVSREVDFAWPYTTGPNVTRSKDWGELRITVSTGNFTDTERYCTRAGQNISNHETGEVVCKESDVLTVEKRDILINSILPEALRLHTERLKVRQVQSNWTVTGTNGKICGLFKVPEAHLTNAVNNTDFLLYVASAPSTAGVLSWGAICQVFSDGQPAVGVINVPASKIVSRYDQRVIRTVAHQIAHALGFSDEVLVSTGIKNSSSTIRYNPLATPVIKGNKTVEKASAHYNCDNLSYVEMDHQYVSGTPVSHLNVHNAKDELMAPDVGAGYYSALTMAIFEDTRFYQADFTKAEVMTWGRNASCDFLNEKCTGDGVMKWPQMFCNITRNFRCTSSRLEIGVCEPSFSLDESALNFRHFAKLRLYGDALPVDSCPYVVPEREGACNRNSSTASDDFEKFNVFSDAARCIDGVFAPKNTITDSRPILGTCAHVKCDNTTKAYSIQVKGSSAYVKCTEGQKVTLSNVSSAFEAGSYITCPPYVEVCQGNVKAVMDFERDQEHSASSSNLSGGDTPSSSGSDVRHSSNHLGSSGSGSDSSHPRGNSAAGVHNARAFLPGMGATVAVILIGLFCV